MQAFSKCGVWFALFAGVVSSAGQSLAQAPGSQTNNPFTNPIVQDPVLVRIGDVTAVPDSVNSQSTLAKARLNSGAIAPDGRFFVIDQRGPVYSLTAGQAPVEYFNLSAAGLGLLNDDGERGFSTIAFHPQFNQVGTAGFGKFYASFSATAAGTPDYAAAGAPRTHDEVVYEFKAANPAAATFSQAAGVAVREVLRVARPNSNHNGGQVGFNPNAAPGSADFGLLYISEGDSGGGGDPLGEAQNTNGLLGKILRVDPLGNNGPGGTYGIASSNVFAGDGNANTRAEIYATGFRNPQRFSWDKAGSQKLFVGDVGQGTVEEVDTITNGGNYGWNAREGSFVYVNTSTVAFPNNPDDPAYIRPIAEYDHGEGSAISGGFVYRGTAIASLTGKYIFGDLVNGRIFYIDPDVVGGGQDALRELRLTEDGTTQKTLLQIINETPGVSAFRVDLRLGQDALGNLFILNKQDGIVRELLPAIVPEPATMIGAAAILLLARRRSAR